MNDPDNAPCYVGFNEARALSAGSLSARIGPGTLTASFNEARALSAGSLCSAASNCRGATSFNEARALSAGSLPGSPGRAPPACPLQ